MAGRWLLRRPLDLSAVQHGVLLEDGEEGLGGGGTVVRAVEGYVDYVERILDGSPRQNAPPTSELCLPLYLVAEQLREDANTRNVF